jgi:DNA ligase-1
MLVATLAALSAELALTQKRTQKTELLAACLRAAEPEQRGLAALYLSGATRQGRLSIGYKLISDLRSVPAQASSTLDLSSFDQRLGELAALAGKGSAARRTLLLTELLEACTEEAQGFVRALLVGELRQGALESLVVDAIARAASVKKENVRRAQMLSADLLGVTELAFAQGDDGLLRVALRMFQPIQPMLAEPAVSIEAALSELAEAALEYKLDGARVQVHKCGSDVRVFSRALNEVSAAVPELVALVRTFQADELVLDGEVIALRDDGTPLPFQETMRRFGRRLDVERLQGELPLSSFFFDCMHVDGRSLLDASTVARHAALSQSVPEAHLMPRIVTREIAEARAFAERALEQGHEGVMAKALEAPYSAGSRGKSWLKVKEVHTLDLVVLAAEWGSGRRRGFLSNLHLGARDDEHGGFVMLGKTFKGLTDALLRTQTEALLARETSRDAYTVYVRPELVVEIAFNDVQRSPHYPGGVALRFARVKRYRPDKSASEADTLGQVRAFLPAGGASGAGSSSPDGS